MSTIRLTDAQRDTFAACGIIVIDGEPKIDFDSVGRALAAVLNEGRGAGIKHLMVAPEGWRILTEPCERCGGTGLWNHGRYPRDCCPNPDCVGGRRVVTLTATCPHGRTSFKGRGWECAGNFRDCSGMVTLGRFTIPALLPVVADQSAQRPFVVIYGGRAVLRQVADPSYTTTWEELSVDPLPRPGQFIARPERVE